MEVDGLMDYRKQPIRFSKLSCSQTTDPDSVHNALEIAVTPFWAASPGAVLTIRHAPMNSLSYVYDKGFNSKKTDIVDAWMVDRLPSSVLRHGNRPNS